MVAKHIRRDTEHPCPFDPTARIEGTQVFHHPAKCLCDDIVGEIAANTPGRIRVQVRCVLDVQRACPLAMDVEHRRVLLGNQLHHTYLTAESRPFRTICQPGPTDSERWTGVIGQCGS